MSDLVDWLRDKLEHAEDTPFEPFEATPTEAAYDWIDRRGATWRLTAHWLRVQGRLTLVGLDVRSPPDSPAEFDQSVLRGLPYARARETTRLDVLAAQGTPHPIVVEVD